MKKTSPSLSGRVKSGPFLVAPGDRPAPSPQSGGAVLGLFLPEATVAIPTTARPPHPPTFENKPSLSNSVASNDSLTYESPLSSPRKNHVQPRGGQVPITPKLSRLTEKLQAAAESPQPTVINFNKPAKMDLRESKTQSSPVLTDMISAGSGDEFDDIALMRERSSEPRNSVPLPRPRLHQRKLADDFTSDPVSGFSGSSTRRARLNSSPVKGKARNLLGAPSEALDPRARTSQLAQQRLLLSRPFSKSVENLFRSKKRRPRLNSTSRSPQFPSAKELDLMGPTSSVRSHWNLFQDLDVEEDETLDPNFVEKCHAEVAEKRLYENPCSVDEFLSTRTLQSDTFASKTIKAWAYLSCFPPLTTTTYRTNPPCLNLHPGVIATLLHVPPNCEDPLKKYTAWDVCSKALLHFYRSRHAESNVHYHLYEVWKEINVMGAELSTKLRNLLALGNHPSYNIYDEDCSDQGEFFALALNEFSQNILTGALIGQKAISMSEQNLPHAHRITSIPESNSHMSFKHLLPKDCALEPHELYDQAKLLAKPIYRYLKTYEDRIPGRVLFRPCRRHSRSFYENMSDNVHSFDDGGELSGGISYLSAPMLVTHWLTAVFYFENALALSRCMDLLKLDPKIEVHSVKNQMKTRSRLVVTVVVKNLDSLQYSPPSRGYRMDSFFIRIRLEFFTAWHQRQHTFRLNQMSRCSPTDLLKSQAIIGKVIK